MELGTFRKDEAGIISGTVQTLLNSFEIEYRKIEKVENGPDYRIYRKGTDTEVGMARIKYGEHSGKEYLNSLIDTPEFAQGIWTALIPEDETTFVMKWSRPRKKSGPKTDNADSQGQAEANE